jgi:hypothetical protein
MYLQQNIQKRQHIFDKMPRTKNPTATTRTSTKAKPKKREPKAPQWQYSDAKQLMAQDMFDGIVPIDTKIVDSEKLYNEFYADHPLFEKFPYKKSLYDSRIKSLQEEVRRLKERVTYEAQAFAHDRAKHPRPTHNTKGELLWNGSEADRWLKIDMSNGLHLQMAPRELRETRQCYQLISKERFRKRIDQLKQKAKAFGSTPGQTASRKNKRNGRVTGDKAYRRQANFDAYVNEKDDEEEYSE